jgi:hypothetical protein
MFKKSLVTIIVGLASVTLLAGCSNPNSGTLEPDNSGPTNPIAPGEPNGPPLAQPGSKYPLARINDKEAQKYCPDVEAVHLADSGISPLTKEVKKAYICKDNFVFEAYDESTGNVKPNNMRTLTVYEVVGGLNVLLEAYNNPNDRINPATACVAMLADPDIVWVSSAGADPVPVYAPVNECGFPQDKAMEAYNGLKLEEIKTITLDTPVAPDEIEYTPYDDIPTGVAESSDKVSA